MATKTKISWTDSTWNPWKGCNKVSRACDGCYALRIMMLKNGIDPKVVFKNDSEFYTPIQRWKTGRKIFTCSMSDFFHHKADSWRDEAWEIIKRTPQHEYLILTKRPERIKEHLPKDWCQKFYSHVWLGTTVENQETIHRIHTLAEIPCDIRWVSFEPLLGPIYLTQKELEPLDWAVIGGMSGLSSGEFKYEKTDLHWFQSLMFQLQNYRKPIPTFFKQLGTYYHYKDFKVKHWAGEEFCKKFPKRFQIRQYPRHRFGEVDIDNTKTY